MEYTLVEFSGEDRIAVMYQEAVAVVSWDRVTRLLQRPAACWVRGHADMQDSAAGVFHHHKYVERLEGGRDHHAEVTGNDRLGMVAHKGSPALGWDAAVPPAVEALGHVLAHGAG